jgi:hypothetical protein
VHVRGDQRDVTLIPTRYYQPGMMLKP